MHASLPLEHTHDYMHAPMHVAHTYMPTCMRHYVALSHAWHNACANAYGASFDWIIDVPVQLTYK